MSVWRSEALFPTGSVEFLLGQAYRLKPIRSSRRIPATTAGHRTFVGGVDVNFQPHLSVSDRIDVDASTGNAGTAMKADLDAVYGRSSLEMAI